MDHALSLPELALLTVVGLLAGAINTIAGGGSLITLPVLIFMGLPANVANGTNRVGVVLQSTVAAWQFRRMERLDGRLGLSLLAPTILGTLLGAQLSVDLDERLFRQIIGVAMLVMLAVMLARPKRWLEGDQQRGPRALWWQIPVFFLIGVYGGFLQAGVGIFLLAALVLLSGHDLVRANALKSLLVAAFTLPALGVFVFNDLVAWIPGLALALGSMLGGYLGSRLTVSWGPRFVRFVLIAVVCVSASRLLGLW